MTKTGQNRTNVDKNGQMWTKGVKNGRLHT